MYELKINLPKNCSECKYCKIKYFIQTYCELLEDFTNFKNFKTTVNCPIYRKVLELPTSKEKPF